MNIIENSVEYCINLLSIIRKIAIKLNLTPSQLLCIYVIPFDGIAQSDLAKKLAIDISTLSRNLDKLIILQMVYKKSSMADKRSYKISLTPKGEDIYNQFNLIIKNKLEKQYGQLDLEDQDHFEEMLNKLNWQLELINK